MRRFNGSKIAIVAIFTGITNTNIAFSQTYEDMVIAENKAYAMLPIRQVSGPGTQMISLSPDGKYALSVVQNQDRRSMIAILEGNQVASSILTSRQVIFWRSATGKSREISGLASLELVIDRIQWLGKSHIALIEATIRSEQHSLGVSVLYRFDTESQKLSEVVRSTESSLFMVSVAPELPEGMILHWTQDQGVVRQNRYQVVSVSKHGNSAPFDLPAGSKNVFVSFQERTGKACVTFTAPLADQRSLAYDFGTKVFRPVRDFAPISSQIPEITIENRKLSIDGRPGQDRQYSCWFTSKKKSVKSDALIAASVRETSRSLDALSVMYLCDEGAFVREIRPISKELFNSAKTAAEKQKAILDAKEAALALIMLAGDQNDRYPTQAEYASMDEKYFKDVCVKDRFVYTYAGGSISDIESPSTTVIGFVEGPGGRAVAYADGHIKWQQNK